MKPMIKLQDGRWFMAELFNTAHEATQGAYRASLADTRSRDFRVFQVGPSGYVVVPDAIPSEYIECLGSFLDGKMIG